VKHNIVILDYKVNYDQVFFWLLKPETRSRTARATVEGDVDSQDTCRQAMRA
jgi:hypothetical protein